MSDQEPRTVELVRIAISTSFVHFLMGSAIGYTGVSLGLFQTQQTAINFTLIFSTVWGLFGASMVWKRERDSVNIYFLDKIARSVLGIDEGSKKIVHFLDYVYFPTADMELGRLHKIR